MTEAPTTTKIEHWMDSDGARRKFWAKATALGYTEDSARKTLNVPHIHDFAGTMMEAIARLEKEAAKASAPDFPPDTPGSRPVENEPEQEPLFPPEDETYQPEPPTEQDQADTDRLYKLTCLLPEAPAWASTKFIDAAGFVWTVTVRAELPADASNLAFVSLRQQIETFGKGSKYYKWVPITNGYSPAVPATAPTGTRSAPPAPGGNGAPAPTSAPMGTSGGGEEVKSGVAKLHTITVDADGRVEFHCAGFRWPFKDTRGGETVAALFDEGLGWTPAHFAPGAKYDGLQLTAHWEKPGKYYDVVRVS